MTRASAIMRESGSTFTAHELDAGSSTSTSAIFSTDSSMLVFTCNDCVVTKYEKFFKISKHAACNDKNALADRYVFPRLLLWAPVLVGETTMPVERRTMRRTNSPGKMLRPGALSVRLYGSRVRSKTFIET